MPTKPIIRLNVSQILHAHYETFTALLSETVTPEQALVEHLREFAADVAKQREDTKDAWAEMAKYEHPETGAGQLKDLRERLKRYNEEGLRDAAEKLEIKAREAAGTPDRGDKTRMITLQSELDKDKANVLQVQASLTSAEGLFTQWSQRYEERNARLTEMRSEYEALEKEGPQWLAQIRDAQKAEAASDADASKNGSVITNAKQLRASLRTQAEMATLHEEAARAVDYEEPSLDEELAAREEAQAGDELIAGWMQQAGAK